MKQVYPHFTDKETELRDVKSFVSPRLSASNLHIQEFQSS